MTDQDASSGMASLQSYAPGKLLEQEAAKILALSAGNTAAGISEYTRDIFDLIIGDQIKEWRVRNVISKAEKTVQILRKKGISIEKIRQLPRGEWYALFDSASKSDEPELEDFWANLIASALDPSSKVSARQKYIEILKILSGDSALFLKNLSGLEQLMEFCNARKEEIKKQKGFDWMTWSASCANIDSIAKKFYSESVYKAHSKDMLQDSSFLSDLFRWRLVCFRKIGIIEQHQSGLGYGRESMMVLSAEATVEALIAIRQESQGTTDLNIEKIYEEMKNVVPRFQLTNLGVELMIACGDQISFDCVEI